MRSRPVFIAGIVVLVCSLLTPVAMFPQGILAFDVNPTSPPIEVSDDGVVVEQEGDDPAEGNETDLNDEIAGQQLELVDGLGDGGQPGDLTREIVVSGERFLFDRVVTLDPQSLAPIAQAGPVTALAETSEPPFEAVFLLSSTLGGSDFARYLPEHVGAPQSACPIDNAQFSALDLGGAIYVYAGLETHLTPETLQQVAASGDAPVYADPGASPPFPEVFFDPGGGLQRFVLTDEGVPAALSESLAFDGAVYDFVGDVTDALDLAVVERVGCAGPYPVLASATAPDDLIVRVADAYLWFSTDPNATLPTGEEATEVPTEEPTEIPTEEPTLEPTPEPTEVPTEEPTLEPTPEPTEIPTEEPTLEPTVEPTEVPTEEPTLEPTVEPTEIPTEEPTAEPTAEPTEIPTEVPTAAPTEEPTGEPAAEPTAVPTEIPTEEPTAAPTEEPTGEPAAEPTAVPTEEPPADPTVEPTVEPTTEPTAEPTQQPAATDVPTAVPTQPLQPIAIVPTLPADVPPPPAVTAVPATTCPGQAGPVDDQGVPAYLPHRIQFGGVAYAFVGAESLANAGTLTTIGCAGAFEVATTDRGDRGDVLYLRYTGEGSTPDLVFRYEVGVTYNVEFEVTGRAQRVSTDDNVYQLTDTWQPAVYSSTSVILFVDDPEDTSPATVFAVNVSRSSSGDVIGEYRRAEANETAPDSAAAAAEGTDLHLDLTIEGVRYVLVNVFVPIGTTTNGFVTMFASEEEGTPLLGRDRRRLELFVYEALASAGGE